MAAWAETLGLPGRKAQGGPTGIRPPVGDIPNSRPASGGAHVAEQRISAPFVKTSGPPYIGMLERLSSIHGYKIAKRNIRVHAI
jgi:hypothetical protein